MHIDTVVWRLTQACCRRLARAQLSPGILDELLPQSLRLRAHACGSRRLEVSPSESVCLKMLETVSGFGLFQKCSILTRTA